MPTYEYECTKHHRFEKFQSMKDVPVKKCPTCGANARRLIGGGAGILFKGSGFYQTDYRSSDYKKKASADQPSSSKSKSDAPCSPSGCAKPDCPTPSKSKD